LIATCSCETKQHVLLSCSLARSVLFCSFCCACSHAAAEALANMCAALGLAERNYELLGELNLLLLLLLLLLLQRP
jgi:hypothetical protein